jgi:hypothetical protein
LPPEPDLSKRELVRRLLVEQMEKLQEIERKERGEGRGVSG